ncbi:MAG: hypothetical protein R2865_07600 [Deinococcales bacterium]
MSSYHTIIIGAGSGGLTVAVGLAGLGKQVALIERGHIEVIVPMSLHPLKNSHP